MTAGGGGAATRTRTPTGTHWTWLIGALCTALSAVYLLVGDVTLLGECVTVWPSCLWALVLVPRVLWLWLRGARRQAAVSLALITIFVAATTETASLFRRRPEARPAAGLPIRIVTWNVAGLSPYEEIASLRPDLVFVQECGHAPALEGPWHGFHWVPGLDPATLSRFPVLAARTERVGPWTEPQVLVADLPGGRRLLTVNVRLVLPAIVTTAAAWEWTDLRRAHEERVAQFRRLAALIDRAVREQRAHSVILAGDFNSPGGTRALDPLGLLLRDAWLDRGRGWGGTMTADLPLSRIDHVWVSPDIDVVDAAVEPRRSSDHRALRVDVRLR